MPSMRASSISSCRGGHLVVGLEAHDPDVPRAHAARAVRATSMATLPPPMTTTRLPTFDVLARGAGLEEGQCREHVGTVGARNRDRRGFPAVPR